MKKHTALSIEILLQALKKHTALSIAILLQNDLQTNSRHFPNQKSQESMTKLVAKRIHGKVVPNQKSQESTSILVAKKIHGKVVPDLQTKSWHRD
ncbi:MAG: hypothetical protein ACO23R_18610 [bacterium]